MTDDEDPSYPYGGSGPSDEDEQWRRGAASVRRRTGATLHVVDGIRAVLSPPAPEVKPADRPWPAGTPRCRKCGRETAILHAEHWDGFGLKPEPHRVWCSACVGAACRRTVNNLAELCKAYRGGDRNVSRDLVIMMGRSDADEWMRAADEKRSGGKGAWT